MNPQETRILQALDAAMRSAASASRIEGIVRRVESKLYETPGEVLSWEAIPLDLYRSPLPDMIRSSWVFILRADTVTGAERHPNSHQRMTSYRGRGDFQTRTRGPWRPHLLRSDPDAPLEERWISIPPNVWHQGVVGKENWVVVSFHTAAEKDLIEERPAAASGVETRQRKYTEAGTEKRSRPWP